MKHKKTILILGSALLLSGAAVATWFSFVYQHYDIPTAQSNTVVSDYDIPNAQFTSSVVGSVHRSEVTIPHHAPLSDGVFLVQLSFGNPSTGEITRVAYGTFGTEALLGGTNPLYGTDGVVMVAADSTFVDEAFASIDGDTLVLDVETDALAGGSLLYARVFGADEGEPEGAPFWLNLPSKELHNALPSGGTILPSIPGNNDEGGGGHVGV